MCVKILSMDKKIKKKYILSSLFCIISLSVGVLGGILIYKYAILSNTERQLLDEYKLLSDEWLYGNEEEYLKDYILSGAISSPATASDDPYTFYTSNVSQQNLSTSYKGFGFSSRYYDGYLYITNVHDGDGVMTSPSSGKLEIGDIIVKAKRDSDTSYFEFKTHTRNEISDYLNDSNYVNETYEICFIHNGEEKSVFLKQAGFNQNTNEVVQYPNEQNDYTMMIRIDTFLGNPYFSIKSTLESQVKKHKINKLIFDLRENGGGYVDQAANLAKLFVKKGTMIYQLINKDGKVTSSSYQTSEPEFEIENYSIIIDSNSASASEIFTLSMRAGTSCNVYGIKSYGKGIAQNLKQYSNGSVVRYTSNYVYGPKKENETLVQDSSLPYSYDDAICIHGSGITPDYGYNTSFGDYTTLINAYDYTTTIGISESAMKYFLKVLNYLYPYSGFPSSYSSSFVFVDAIKKYTSILNEKYSASYSPFDSEGRMSKDVNDKFNKETYDQYLIDYANVTNIVLGE